MSTTIAPDRTEWLHDGTAMVYRGDAPGIRYVVTHDDSAPEPSEWWDDTAELHVYRCADRHGPVRVADTTSAIADAFFTVWELHRDDALALKVARRYARIVHGWSDDDAAEHIAIATVRGYSQSDWWDVIAIAHPGHGTAASYIDEWGMWARGDVYVVSTEEYVACDMPELCHASAAEHWEPCDDLTGGIYASSVEEATEGHDA